MRKPKILMLGWEFPPIVSGGLGVACYGLTKSLSQYADISLILPKTDSSFKLDNVELIGINQLDIKSIKSINTEIEYEKFSDLHLVETDFLPYGNNYIQKNETIKETEVIDIQKYIEEIESFENNDLYGKDIIGNVIKYANICTKIASTLSFDIIHAHDWMTYLAGVQIKAKTGKPLVVHVHATEIDRSGPENKGNIFQIEKTGMQSADCIIPVSIFTSQIIQDYYGISESKIFPVHNGVDFAEPLKKEKNTQDKVVMYLGRLTSQKGPEYFLDMAERVIEKIPNIRFVMAGTGDKFKSLLENKSTRNLGNRFHFTGFLNSQKVKELFAMADVYCMPSVSEPFGLSALEAAQFGVPCVISKQSGVAEVLQSALSADFWDVFKMAEHIITLLENPELANEVVNKSYKDLEKLSWDESAKKIMGLYQSFPLK